MTREEITAKAPEADRPALHAGSPSHGVQLRAPGGLDHRSRVRGRLARRRVLLELQRRLIMPRGPDFRITLAQAAQAAREHRAGWSLRAISRRNYQAWGYSSPGSALEAVRRVLARARRTRPRSRRRHAAPRASSRQQHPRRPHPGAPGSRAVSRAPPPAQEGTGPCWLSSPPASCSPPAPPATIPVATPRAAGPGPTPVRGRTLRRWKRRSHPSTAT